MNESDAAVRRFLEGDEDAFSQLVFGWQTKLYNLAWRFLGNREDAQDVVQETFLSVFKSLGTLRDPARFPTWIYSITLNHCRGKWRSHKPALSLDDPAFTGENGEELLPFSSLVSRSSGHAVETADLIRKALMGLSDEHRTAIVLKEYVGLTLEEVAEVMGCPLSTAKSRLYHGLRGVQRTLRRMGLKNED
jgi:RNA polymerase sigma-70 factor (ECF subfamily)